ncbi:MAG: hypothetical protein H6511_06240 [Holophagales bacterium]|nr:hypothetical protein [Holophagales bacterium]
MIHPRTLALAAALGFSAAAFAAQPVYLGSEFQVNATSSGSQIAPAVAAGDGEGSFFAVWQSFDQDGSGAGVYGRVYSSDGAPVSGELRLSTTTAGDQITPAVASRNDQFQAVWASQSKDGNGFGVVLRLFDGSGGPVNGPHGGEIVVNQTTAGNQIDPAIAAGGAQLVVVWTGPNPASPSQTEVWARRYGLDGQALSSELRANATSSGNQSQPSVAVADDGSFLVAWTADQGDGSGYGVFARRFDAAGNATTGDLVVPTTTLYDQSTPSVAALSTGGWVVAWTSYLQETPSQVGPQPIVFAQRFDASGGKVGAPIQVTAQAFDRQENPSVDAESDGGFVVAWQATLLATGDRQVRIQRYDAAGVSAGGELPLNSTPTGDQVSPAVAAQPGGRFVGVWSSFGQDGSSWGIFGQRFGTPLEPCAPGPTTLCLNDGRFKVEVDWATALGTSGEGHAVALTDDTGYFWFFDAANVEIVIKVLEACTPFGNYWVFAGGLTDVQVSIVVTDSDTGTVRAYQNPLGTQFLPIQDTGHFFVCSAAAPGDPTPPAASAPAPTSTLGRSGTTVTTEDTSPCVADAETLCLNGGRFEVRTSWTTFQGASGDGQAVALTADTGYFWFFGAANVEMVIKVLEGCVVNGSYWIYAGGLTDVETHIAVRDTATGAVWTADNPQQTPFQPIQDVNAFPTCP